MNILITGANGFIGQALCKRMLTDGYQVRGAVRGAEKTEIGYLRSDVGGLRAEVGDIGPETDWSEALDGIVGIVHLAARVHVICESAADPLAEFRKVNTAGTLNLARQAVAAGVKRFVFISTIKVNGERTRNKSRDQGSGARGQEKTEAGGQKSEVGGQGGEPKEFFSEKDVPEPQDPYAVSKWEAEQGLLAIAEETGLEVVIIRPPLVYGPGVKANFRSLMKWVRIGVPLPLGAVHNKRSFVALDNLVSFIIHCIDHPRAASEVFLISDDEDVSTTELLQKMAHAFGKRSFLLPVPVGLMIFVAGLLGKKNVADRLFGSLRVDISKARDMLGWKPVITMDEGLKRMKEGERRLEAGRRF
ncbi:MAG: SDR family oxidoreductase [Desulfobacteraceae bacterium]|uniref:SDR family oxidoreductase n=1 Tax=Candidatus Desulfaltia bathyphila TaxID=2841697 RepID=A0A8J6N4I6_9BACT|nr:SDR family oxidoreductase [Candidatus Desulfaltia bathyphila]MBL7196338.1 SDR family oxidoreductase [Desulfobacterales bacterium]